MASSGSCPPLLAIRGSLRVGASRRRAGSLRSVLARRSGTSTRPVLPAGNRVTIDPSTTSSSSEATRVHPKAPPANQASDNLLQRWAVTRQADWPGSVQSIFRLRSTTGRAAGPGCRRVRHAFHLDGYPCCIECFQQRQPQVLPGVAPRRHRARDQFTRRNRV